MGDVMSKRECFGGGLVPDESTMPPPRNASHFSASHENEVDGMIDEGEAGHVVDEVALSSPRASMSHTTHSTIHTYSASTPSTTTASSSSSSSLSSSSSRSWSTSSELPHTNGDGNANGHAHANANGNGSEINGHSSQENGNGNGNTWSPSESTTPSTTTTTSNGKAAREKLVPCERCVLVGRAQPSLVDMDVCMCRVCWDSGGEAMRQVVRHHNGVHDRCPPDYPDDELRFLPVHTDDYINHWRAEWRHAHGDHSLCDPSYMFGCTSEERLQLEMLQQHQAGIHTKCEAEFPRYLLKENVGASTASLRQEVEELDSHTKLAWQAHWKHCHDDHTLCRLEYGYECEGMPTNTSE